MYTNLHVSDFACSSNIRNIKAISVVEDNKEMIAQLLEVFVDEFVHVDICKFISTHQKLTF